MSEPEVRKLLSEHGRSWDDFLAWMWGQTFGINDDGSHDYYDHDVMKFCRYGKRAAVTD